MRHVTCGVRELGLEPIGLNFGVRTLWFAISRSAFRPQTASGTYFRDQWRRSLKSSCHQPSSHSRVTLRQPSGTCG